MRQRASLVTSGVFKYSLGIAAGLLIVTSLGPPARAGVPFYYYAGGQANHFEPARFHAAVVTASPAVEAKLTKVLEAQLGGDVATIQISSVHLTIVEVPEASGRTPLNTLLEQAGFQTHVAFSGRLDDGREAWPAVVLPQVRVHFRSAESATKVVADLRASGISVIWERNGGTDFLLDTPSSEKALILAADLVESGKAEFASPDLLFRHWRGFTPNDNDYDRQWHLTMIGASAAWDIERGSSTIKIAIIDDGTDTDHPDLSAHIEPGYDIVGNGVSPDNDPNPSGDDAHGTACAGLAAAVSNNNRGVAGVCNNCHIMPIRIMRSGTYTKASDDEDAFNWARTHGAKVLSNSWGPMPPINHNYFPDGLRQEIDRAVAANVVVLFASGNENTKLACPSGIPWEPAAYANVISVGASSPYDKREDYSNYGDAGCHLTLVAPAGSVTTDIAGSRGYDSSDYTHYFGGTSAATPVTAGAVGILLSINSGLTWGQVVEVLKSTATKITDSKCNSYNGDGYNQYCGHGRLNLYAAAYRVSTGNVCQPDPAGEKYGEPNCSDGSDNDCDGLKDAADPSCFPDDVPVGDQCTMNQCGTLGKFCLDDFPDNGYCTDYCEGGDTCEAGAACWTCWCDTQSGTKQAGCDCDPDGCTCNRTANECDPDDPVHPVYQCPCDPDCNICMDVCMDDQECRSGYICEYIFSTDVKVCYPGCETVPDFCLAGETCNTSTGRCEHDGPVGVGGACSDYLECANNGYCYDDPVSIWPDGYCIPECNDNGSCPPGAVCLRSTSYALCLKSCNEKSECRQGYGCWSGFVDNERVCYGACTSADCGFGTVCCATTGACESSADCDPDPTCSCNDTPQCDANCDCDPDCCTCNEHPDACDVGCLCDPACSVAPCECDLTWDCDDGCDCDTDCLCDCDTTFSCDADCDCDPDCGDTGICGCMNTTPGEANVLLTGGLLFFWASRRVRRRKDSDARRWGD